MALYEDSIDSIAKLLNISRQTLCDKRDGRSQFKRDEMNLLAVHWNLTTEEIVEMFSLKGDLKNES